MMKATLYILSCFVLLNSEIVAQDSLKVITMAEVPVEDNRILKRIGLYDAYEQNNIAEINGFTQLDIFKNEISDEIWFTENTSCVNVGLGKNEKDAYLDVKWNKDQDGCDWVGIGFGWDFWSSKDMGQIINVAALEIEVRSKGKTMGNLPWAFGFEDYAGGQAWTGFTKKFVPNGEITADWTKVQIPLALFPFEEFDCDPSNIKQLIIQLFAQDAVEINAIRIVPFEGKLKEEVLSARIAKSTIKLDGDLSDWKNEFISLEKGNSFAVQNTSDSLFIAIQVNDDSPRVNSKQQGELWNGDAIEIAFATNSSANPKRNLFLLSDYHIGLNCGATPYLWNFSDDKAFSVGNFAIKANSAGYTVEIAIPLKDLMKKELEAEQTISFEIAIDKGDKTNSRTEQIRWNSSGAEGFHTNPSMWGTLVFK
jgi:Carbohydrate family 9 binding domain-like